ncbi:MAG: response regulator [Sedimentitalea sp.]
MKAMYLETNTIEFSPQGPDKVKALILDDSTFDRKYIRRLCRTSGLQINLHEADGLEALSQMVDQSTFDVILLDHNLPEGDGFEALKLIRASERNADCPAVMVTGMDQSDIAVKALKLGCKDYVAKEQLTAQSLKSLILNVLETSKKERSIEQRRSDQLAALSDVIMTELSCVLQPEIAKIVRNMRSFKRGVGEGGVFNAEELDIIEKNCISLWASLLETKGLLKDSERVQDLVSDLT